MLLNKEYLLNLKQQILDLKKYNDVYSLLPQMSAYSFLYECNKDRLNCIALNYLGRLYTYDELFKKIDIVAKALYEKGIRPKDNVGIAMLTTPESIITFYAVNKIGALSYMINATHDKETLRQDFKDSKAKLLVVNDIFYDKNMMDYVTEAGIKDVVTTRLDDSFPIIFWGDRIKLKMIENIKKITTSTNLDNRCINWKQLIEIGEKSTITVSPFYEKNMGIAVASTSGSTGKPKRPMITNENMNSMPVQMGMTCDAFSPNDSIFTTLPIWIFYSLVNSIHEPLCLGVTVDMDPLVNSKKISKRIKQYRFNHWNTIPAYVEDMVRDKKIKKVDLSHFKTITTGGDYRTPKLKSDAEKLLKRNNSNVEIGQGYGASETCGSFCYTYEYGMPAESIGKPLIGNKFKIIDLESGKTCGINETGELYLFSPTIMKEYYGNSLETSKALISDENGIKWYKTEDMAHYDEKGLLFIDGRIRRIELSKDSKGMIAKVFPDVVKQIISQHPSVEQCEILMVPDVQRITRPVAYLVLKPGIKYNNSLETEIYKLCIQNHVESYVIPTEYEYVDELPRTASLKVDLNELQKQYDLKHKDLKVKKLLKN